ncbi:hypothetical protein AXG93_961s1140 [Marchantia polymorpha subsp. ruderalis]|uniref:CBS domain-containing protein n=1 Tax=Marchantia polymorpha subsp. ruderalis TaxID=1480154 RepID=A0A176VRD4_MARPO|nr:hypothetical protein AXG93_961s1140 [Marchantia polymorpha subsp. ruderalis]
MAAECACLGVARAQLAGPAIAVAGKGISLSVGSCSVSCLPLRTAYSLQQVDSRRSADVVARAGFGARSGASSRSSVSFVPRATVADSPQSKRAQDLYTVGDFMTRLDELYVAKPSTSVDEALEVLVEKRITGLPVVDDHGRLVGVVSDYDLLALDSISGKRSEEGGFFPAANSTWKAFKEIQVLLNKTHGKTVGELMSPSPLVVRELTNIEDAARLLLETKFRRLPVVDDAGKLVGLLTRDDLLSYAKAQHKIFEDLVVIKDFGE